MKQLVIIAFLICIYPNNAKTFSLDDIYRDVVRSSNEGYLPTFITNRNSPTLDFNEVKLEEIKEIEQEENFVSISKDKELRKLAEIEAEKRWKKTIIAIQENRITPIEIEELELRTAMDDPKAIEIYAWMFAKGVGVQKDLIKSFELYKKGIVLGIENSQENALKVYSVMTQEQKEEVIYQQPTL